MRRKYLQLLKNFSLITVGKVAAKVVGILVLPFYTKWLSPSDYGIIDVVLAYMALLTEPVTLCINSSVFVFPNGRTLKKQRLYFSSALFFSLLILLVLFAVLFVGQTIARGCVDLQDTLFLRYGVLLWGLVSTQFISDCFRQMLRVTKQIALFALMGVVQSLAMIAICFWSLPKFGFNGYLLSMIASATIVIAYMFFAGRLWRYLSVSYMRWRYYWQMLRYSLPQIPGPIMLWVQTSFNRPLLGETWGLAAVGIFGFAARFPLLIGQFSDSICQTWEISAMEECKKQDFNSFYNHIFRLFVFCGMWVVVLLSLANEVIFHLFINERFHVAVKYSPTIAVSMIFMVYAQFVGVNFTVRREARKFLYSSATSAILAGVGNILLIPVLGVWGAVLTMLATSVGVLALRLGMSVKSNPIFEIRRYFACAIMLIVWAALYPMMINAQLVKIIVAMVILLITCVLFRRDTCKLVGKIKSYVKAN